MEPRYDRVATGFVDKIGQIVDSGAAAIGCDNVCVHLVSLDGSRIICQAVSKGYRATQLAFGLELSGCRAVDECLRTLRPVIVDDALADPRVAKVARERYGLRACVYVPIVRDGRGVGVLVASSLKRHAWSSAEVAEATAQAERCAEWLRSLREHVISAAHRPTDSGESTKASDPIQATNIELLRSKAMLDAVPGVCAIVDENLLTLEVNESFLGTRSDAVLGVTLRELFFESDRAAELRDAMQQIFARELGASAMIVSSRGRHWRVDLRAVPTSDASLAAVSVQGPPDEIAICASDVSDVFLAHDQLQASHHMQALGQLTSSIGHEFNNILAILATCCDALSSSLADDDALAQVAMMESTVQRGAKLTKQLLTFARVDHQSPRTFDLLSQLSVWWPFLENAIGKSRKLSLISSGPISIHADPDQLELVLVNLLVNARDATQDGATVSIRLESTSYQQKSFVSLSVEDRGVGMTPDTLDRATQPFFSTKPKGRGTGLGLAIARDVVESTGGVFEIESAVGTGTTVRMLFPAALAAKQSVTKAKAPGPSADRNPGTRVLLIDDEPLYANGVKRGLTAAGMLVRTAGTAAEAIDTLRADPSWPEVILLDFMLPDGTGAEVLPRLLDVRPDIPVLICTGYGDGDELRAAMTRAKRVLSKPMPVRDLRRAIEEVTLVEPKA